jgi:hypothetical protein
MLLRIYRFASLLGAIVWALLGGKIEAQQARLALTPAPTTSTDPAATPETTMGGVLRRLTAGSGVVFLGRVRKIAFATTPMADMQSGTVTITLDVLEPIAGNVGSTYSLHEWSGLWTMGRERYHVGQRAVFFLHAPGAAGFSSPVGGMQGVVPLIPTTADASPMLDIRWLATRVQRSAGSPIAYAGTGGISLTDAIRVITHPAEMLEPALLPLPPGVLPVAPAPSRPRPILVTSPVDPLHGDGAGAR